MEYSTKLPTPLPRTSGLGDKSPIAAAVPLVDIVDICQPNVLIIAGNDPIVSAGIRVGFAGTSFRAHSGVIEWSCVHVFRNLGQVSASSVSMSYLRTDLSQSIHIFHPGQC